MAVQFNRLEEVSLARFSYFIVFLRLNKTFL